MFDCSSLIDGMLDGYPGTIQNCPGGSTGLKYSTPPQPILHLSACTSQELDGDNGYNGPDPVGTEVRQHASIGGGNLARIFGAESYARFRN
jgi:hypothetical protein